MKNLKKYKKSSSDYINDYGTSLFSEPQDDAQLKDIVDILDKDFEKLNYISSQSTILMWKTGDSLNKLQVMLQKNKKQFRDIIKQRFPDVTKDEVELYMSIARNSKLNPSDIKQFEKHVICCN
jgi:bifunctional pyridoxal-dependent enzyme with beta-cystathionase and maltose regulon repressor activities